MPAQGGTASPRRVRTLDNVVMKLKNRLQSYEFFFIILPLFHELFSSYIRFLTYSSSDIGKNGQNVWKSRKVFVLLHP